MRPIVYSRCLLVFLAICVAACDRANPRISTTRALPANQRRIASLVPAATDMLIGMGARAQLVAVSNYDTAPELKDLPRVGDYQMTDWEMLARLRPEVMIIQIAPERLPPALARKAGELGIQLENVTIHRLGDVLETMRRLGAIAGRETEARAAIATLQTRLDDVRKAALNRPPLRVMICREADGREVIGPDNFLDDLLPYLNATNACEKLGSAYPSIDRETIVKLAPEAVIVLLPEASAETIARAKRFWDSLPESPAVRNQKVFIITDRHALVPGSHLGDLAATMAEKLR